MLSLAVRAFDKVAVGSSPINLRCNGSSTNLTFGKDLTAELREVRAFLSSFGSGSIVEIFVTSLEQQLKMEIRLWMHATASNHAGSVNFRPATVFSSVRLQSVLPRVFPNAFAGFGNRTLIVGTKFVSAVLKTALSFGFIR